MAPSEYTWDLAEKDKKRKLNEKEHQLRLQNFIYVMASVRVKEKNDISITVKTNGDIICRHLLNKRARADSDTGQAAIKRSKMMTSTPVSFRCKPESSLDLSTTDVSMEASSQHSSDANVSGNKKTNVSDGMEEMKIQKETSVSTLEALADKIIQVDNFCDASDAFISRQNLVQRNVVALGGALMDHVHVMKDPDCAIKAPDGGDNPSQNIAYLSGMDQNKAGAEMTCVDYSDWSSNEQFDQHENEKVADWFWIHGDESLLVNLFHDDAEQFETLGLEDLFDEKNLDQQHLVDYIQGKRKNQLYEIFKSSPMKRKISPSAQSSRLKLRRMTINGPVDTSPRLGTPARLRGRTNTFSSPTCEPVRRKKTPARRLIPGQRLITGIWARLKEKVVVESTDN